MNSSYYFSFCVLSDLPSGPFSEIVTKWLSWKEISNLDCALCNKVHRALFLRMLNSDGIVFDFIKKNVGSKTMKAFIGCSIKRNIRVDSAVIGVEESESADSTNF